MLAAKNMLWMAVTPSNARTERTKSGRLRRSLPRRAHILRPPVITLALQ